MPLPAIYMQLRAQIDAQRAARASAPTPTTPTPAINIGASVPSVPSSIAAPSPVTMNTPRIQSAALMPADTGLTTTADVTSIQADNRAKAMQFVFAAGLIAAGLFFANGGGKNW